MQENVGDRKNNILNKLQIPLNLKANPLYLLEMNNF